MFSQWNTPCIKNVYSTIPLKPLCQFKVCLLQCQLTHAETPPPCYCQSDTMSIRVPMLPTFRHYIQQGSHATDTQAVWPAGPSMLLSVRHYDYRDPTCYCQPRTMPAGLSMLDTPQRDTRGTPETLRDTPEKNLWHQCNTLGTLQRHIRDTQEIPQKHPRNTPET